MGIKIKLEFNSSVDPRDELPPHNLAIALPVFSVLNGAPRSGFSKSHLGIRRRWTRTARNRGWCDG